MSFSQKNNEKLLQSTMAPRLATGLTNRARTKKIKIKNTKPKKKSRKSGRNVKNHRKVMLDFAGKIIPVFPYRLLP